MWTVEIEHTESTRAVVTRTLSMVANWTVLDNALSVRFESGKRAIIPFANVQQYTLWEDK